MEELECEVNPELDAFYLDCLNAAFGGWGERDLYDWVFKRSCGSFAPDQLVLRLNSEVLAGSGVSYRRVRLARGASFDIGIMTGSWTLPSARGRGCFNRMVHESVELCRARSCPLLLAFVTHDNPSRRVLERAGSAMFASHYVFSSDVDPEHVLDVTEARTEAHQLYRDFEDSRRDSSHFIYPSFENFRGQLLERVRPIERLRVGTATVLIERRAETDHLIAAVYRDEVRKEVIASLALEASQRGRKFLAFWMGGTPEHLDGKAGFMTALVADAEGLSRALDVDDEWSQEDSTCVANPESRWYLGDWRIDSGERM